MNIDATAADSLERIADPVRQQHSSLDTMLLSPVGEFQTRTVTLETLMRELTGCLAESFQRRPTTSLNEAQLERCGVHEAYHASVTACVRDLGLSAATSARLFGVAT